MSQFKETSLILDKKFDPKTCRHYLNGTLSVLHCHHYSTLYTQLAVDAGETELLSNVSEETFYKTLTEYYTEHNVIDFAEKIELASQYYAALGLGTMKVRFAGENSGEVELPYSHLDTGWIKKWGQYDKHVNYISAGYINGMFSAIFDKPINTFKTIEIQSIVTGAEFSLFKVYKA